MSKEDLKAELEQLRKENAALRKEFASATLQSGE
jgi:ribosomal protein L29